MKAGRRDANRGRAARPALLLLVALWLAGCASSPFGLEDVSLPYPPGTVRDGLILHARTGVPLEPEQLIGILSDVRVVYVSESHDSVSGHAVQAAIIDGLARRRKGRVAVGLEMFPASAQDELDRFSAGEMSPKEFERLWAAHWNVDIDYYRPVLDVVRKHRLPLVGLNADKDLVGRVSGHGMEGLSPEAAAALPRIDRSDRYQRAFLEGIFAGHGKGSGMLDRFLLIQNLWEETMAESAARYLASPEGRDRQLVILAGGHHIDYGFGIPRRLFRRRPVSYAMVKPEYISLDPLPEESLMDVETPELPLPATDFYWFVEYREPEFRHVRLGVYIRPAEGGDGIEVLDVLEGTPAAAAGLRKGDVLLRLDDEPLRENFDLTYALRRFRPGDRLTLEVRRDGAARRIPVRFPAE